MLRYLEDTWMLGHLEAVCVHTASWLSACQQAGVIILLNRGVPVCALLQFLQLF